MPWVDTLTCNYSARPCIFVAAPAFASIWSEDGRLAIVTTENLSMLHIKSQLQAQKTQVRSCYRALLWRVSISQKHCQLHTYLSINDIHLMQHSPVSCAHICIQSCDSRQQHHDGRSAGQITCLLRGTLFNICISVSGMLYLTV